MKTVAERIREMQEEEERIKGMGGAKAVEKQHASGKLTARERLDLFFDPGTFRETDIFVKHRCVNFGMEKVEIPADGVVTGFGRVNGRPVFAFAQDFTSRAGSLGEMHSKKICKVMDLALKAGAPLVGFNDSGGARIQEGVDSLSAYGQIFYRNALASGVIPQISAIMGPTAGGAVYSPAMTDFVFMVKNTSYMFITGPDVIKSVTGEEITFEDLGGALAHNQKSGVAHFACESDADAIEQIKRLLAFLPSNNLEEPPLAAATDPANREAPALDVIIPDDPRASYSMHEVIETIVDDGEFFEPHAYFAQNMLVGFARLNGRPVGIIANNPQVLAGCLDVDAADKATRFIRFCDAFNIPMLTIADVPGYMPGSQQEWGGIIRHGAKLLWCYSEATVPKLTLITRKDYGGSYLAMCSRDLGADMVLA
ncbi:MAG TPA: carboxyl transferase domain-containing protein, partial [Desulfobaccales bacterium]|nr:carboxyl transferase domain-containing protein [Desulfobaccales bacterium]